MILTEVSAPAAGAVPVRAFAEHLRLGTGFADDGSLDAALDSGRFPNLREELELYRRIATLDASAPLPPLKDQSPTWAEASSLLDSRGLGNLAGRIAARSA